MLILLFFGKLGWKHSQSILNNLAKSIAINEYQNYQYLVLIKFPTSNLWHWFLGHEFDLIRFTGKNIIQYILATCLIYCNFKTAAVPIMISAKTCTVSWNENMIAPLLLSNLLRLILLVFCHPFLLPTIISPAVVWTRYCNLGFWVLHLVLVHYFCSIIHHKVFTCCKFLRLIHSTVWWLFWVIVWHARFFF